MEQTDFESIVERTRSTNVAVIITAAEEIHKLALSKEIQDFGWPPNLYDCLWTALCVCWKESASSPMREYLATLWRIENLIWNTFKIILNLPEFDLEKAAQSSSLNKDTLRALFARVLLSSNLTSAQQCLHWIYQNRLDIRPFFRRSLGSAILNEGIAAPGTMKNRHKDGGRSRDHVAALLEVLICIIEGFTRPLQGAHIGLLQLVLMPLHKPNEMVEWRDQIPILQQYHGQLVRCLKTLIEKSKEVVELGSLLESTLYNDSIRSGASYSGPVQKELGLDVRSKVTAARKVSRSLLPIAVESLMTYWPATIAANTPKEVLMLHELEALVAMAAPTTPSSSCIKQPSSTDSPSSSIDEDFLKILPMFLNRIVLSLGSGGQSDNFRTTQRALQVFKNKTILQLLNSQHSSDNNSASSDVTVSSSSTPSVLSTAFSALLPALYRGGRLSWNPTVNKMTALVLRALRTLDPILFQICADRVLGMQVKVGTAAWQTGCSGEDNCRAGFRLNQDGEKERSADHRPQQLAYQSHVKKKIKLPVPNFFRGDDPRSRNTDPSVTCSNEQSSGRALSYPLGVTGVAPWAFQAPTTMAASHSNSEGICSSSSSSSLGICNYPMQIGTANLRGSCVRRLPVFNVATSMPVAVPRAFKKSDRDQVLASGSGSATAAYATDLATLSEEQERDYSLCTFEGYHLLLDYMEKCLPSQTDDAAMTKDGDWSAIQAALTPTLLPELRFHDLVFGHILGQGSFGVVTYARMIVREKSRLEWPEYAVKILSAETILREGYDGASIREMAVLQTVKHPGFARLVSFFRYTKSAYLVLEYAGGGDLHSLVVQSSSRRGPISMPLSHLCTRFVLGEVVAALLSLHEMGLSYNDLKPENILITEMGHIKIADFGACRAYTSLAAEMLDSRMRALAGGSSLRNGDWRDCDPQDADLFIDDIDSGSGHGSDFVVDDRLEGTPAYMPPEMLRGDREWRRDQGNSGGLGLGAIYEDLSDSWALGCLASFCLHGRPLYVGTAEEVLRQHDRESEEQTAIVRFNVSDKEDTSRPEEADLSDGTGQAAAIFIASLLCRDPTNRLSLREAVSHPYLTNGAMETTEGHLHLSLDPLTLHLSAPSVTLPIRTSKESEEEVDGSGKATDCPATEEHLWARRQFSILWAPMPASFSSAKEGLSGSAMCAGESPYSLVSILETDWESSAAFSS